jgi:hypothetical protein
MQNYNFNLVNGDTDSIMVNKADGSPFTKEEQSKLLEELNSIFPEHISWDADGYFPKVLILKAKNYVMVDESGKKKIKGSALKDAKKPRIFLDFIREVVDYLLDERQNEIGELYKSYVKKTFDIKDIKLWSKKITITDKILKCKGYEYMTDEQIKEKKLRANEWKVWDAIKHREFQEGDKVYVFFKNDETLCVAEEYTTDYNQMKLVKNLHDCLKVFKNVVDISIYPNYALKKNKAQLLDFSNKTDTMETK